MTKSAALAWITEVFEDSPGRIREDTPRTHIPGWDSLGTLSLIAGFDEKFDIQLSEGDIEAMRVVNDILEILHRHGALEEAA